jgi:predicted ferric reductase
VEFWENVTWIVARAGGFTAYGLLTLGVVVGLALSLRWQSARWPRLINSELHNFINLLGMAFLIIHIGAIWLDPFTHFSVLAMVVPFMSSYRPLWMGLGIVALYLGIAIAISTWLRPLIGYRLWRQIHTFTLALFALATAHGIFTGSDARAGWAIIVYAVSLSVVGALFLWRLRRSAADSHARQTRQHAIQSRRPRPAQAP